MHSVTKSRLLNNSKKKYKLLKSIKTMFNDVDTQYLTLMRSIKENGSYKLTRAGNVVSLFGLNMRFDLSDGLPILTTKKVFTKGVFHELLWFLSGNTNIRYLVENDVHIWDDDAYRYYKSLMKTDGPTNIASKNEFLENVINGESIKLAKKIGYGEINYTFGDLGPVYGKQWRSFGCNGIDQIKNVIETLKNNPDDRRMLVVAYNPDVANVVALPPCHVMFQFYARPLSHTERVNWFVNNIKKGEELIEPTESKLDELNTPKHGLSLMWTQRSVDWCLGLPYNILSYATLTHMIAQCVNMVPDELIFSGGDCHIYLNQMDGVEEQLSRDPLKYGLPKLKLNPEIKNIDDFKYEDISVEGYESYSKIQFPLSVG